MIRSCLAVLLLFVCVLPVSAQEEVQKRLRGRVVADKTGDPIPGARIQLFPGWARIGDLEALAQPFAVVETDADGRYEFDGTMPERAPLHVRVTKPGFVEYQTPENEHTPMYGDPDVFDLTLVPGIPVRGRVLAPDGSAVGPGLVEVRPGAGMSRTGDSDVPRLHRHVLIRRSVSVDADGRFCIHVVPGRWRLRIVVVGHPPQWERITVAGPDEAERRFVVEPGATLSGRLVDSDGRGIADAWLRIGRKRAARSDEHGAFRIGGMLGFPQPAKITHPEYVTHTVKLQPDTEVDHPPIELTRARWLLARFVDQDGNSLELRSMALKASGRKSRGYFRRHGEVYRSSPLSPKAGSVRVHFRDYVDPIIEWPAGDGPHDLGVVQLKQGTTALIQVTDSRGNPIEKASVSAVIEGQQPATFRIDRIRTDARGEALLAGLPEEPLRLRVAKHSYLVTEQVLRVEPGAECSIVPVTLRRGATLRMRVVSHSGSPLPGVKVSYREGGTSHGPPAMTDNEGRVELTRLPVGPELVLTLRSDAHEPTELPIEPLAEEEIRDLGDQVLSSGATIQGIVHDELGAPVAGVAVAVRGRPMMKQARTDEHGRFAIFGLPPGEYRTTFHAKDHDNPANTRSSSTLYVDVTVAEQETRSLDIAMRRSNVHVGVVRFEDRKPIHRASVVAVSSVGTGSQYQVYTDEEGRFGLPLLPDGPLKLMVRHERYHREFELESPAELPTEIVFERGATLVVRLQLPEGVPPPRAIQLVTPQMQAPARVGFGYAPVVDGVATYEHLTAGAVELSMWAQGFERSASRALVLDAGHTLEVEWALTPKPERAITVRVTDPVGIPIVGARVDLYGAGNATTGSDGCAEFTARETVHGVRVTADGYITKHARENVDGAVLAITLDPEATLRWQVLTHAGEPAEEIWVMVKTEKATGSGATDADGTVHITKLGGGVAQVTMTTRGTTVGQTTISIVAGEVNEGSHTLPRPFTIDGRVLINGKPATGGQVNLHTPPVTGRTRAAAKIRSDGSFALTLYTPGLYRIVISIGGMAERRQFLVDRELVTSQAIDLEFALYRLDGRVIDAAGNPVAGVMVSYGGGQRYRTDDAGRFEFARVKPGKYSVRVDLPPGEAYYPIHPLHLDRDTALELRPVMGHSVTIDLGSDLPYSVSSVAAGRGRQLARGEGPTAEVWLPVGPQQVLVTQTTDEGTQVAYVAIEVPAAAPVAITLRPSTLCSVRIWPAGVLPTPDIDVIQIDSLDDVGVVPWGTLPCSRYGGWVGQLPLGRYRLAATLTSGRVVERVVEIVEPAERGAVRVVIAPGE